VTVKQPDRRQDDVIFNEPGRRSRCRAGRRREPICRGFTRQRDTAMGGITDNISCVPIRESKADTQPRNEVRSVVSAGPSCHRRRKASKISPGHVSRRRRASAKANSLTPRRQSVGRGLRRDGNMGALGRPARSLPPWCQTNLVLPVSSAVSVRCNAACEMEAVRKWPISRLLPIVLAGRSLAG